MIHPHYQQRLNIACAVELANILAGCLPDEGVVAAHLQRRLQALAEEASRPDPTFRGG